MMAKELRNELVGHGIDVTSENGVVASREERVHDGVDLGFGGDHVGNAGHVGDPR